MASDRVDIEKIAVNLYEILDLNEEAVRELTKEEQDTVIEKAYERLNTVCPCDENGDSLDPVRLAYDILKVRKKRASHNNLLDFNHGFYRRWKSIFCPECEGKSRIFVCLQQVIKLLWNIGKSIIVTLPGKAFNKLAIPVTIIFVIKEGVNSVEEAKRDFLSQIRVSLGDDVPRLYLLSTAEVECPETEPRDKFRLKCVSDGPWLSRMVVSYSFLDTQMRQIASGSGASVTLPGDCRNIQVHFEILRFPFVWCDLKRWNRFHQEWEEAGEAHVFEYAEPSGDRTFTIGGSLYFEKVLRVTDKMNDDVDDM